MMNGKKWKVMNRTGDEDEQPMVRTFWKSLKDLIIIYWHLVRRNFKQGTQQTNNSIFKGAKAASAVQQFSTSAVN